MKKEQGKQNAGRDEMQNDLKIQLKNPGCINKYVLIMKITNCEQKCLFNQNYLVLNNIIKSSIQKINFIFPCPCSRFATQRLL